MVPPAGEINDELLRVAGCVRGDTGALAWLREKYQSDLLRILLSRGASRTEAEDLLADLWSDCVPGGEDKPSLLEKFGAKSKLLGWLSTVATRRWIDFKRRQSRIVHPADSEDHGADWPAHVSAPERIEGEDALVEILRRSLQSAFDRCTSETVVLLRLRYVHKLSQRELAQMLGWHESKTSRLLAQTMQEIETATLSEIGKHDPWLSMTWDDFVDLCNSVETEFL